MRPPGRSYDMIQMSGSGKTDMHAVMGVDLGGDGGDMSPPNI